MINFEFQLKYCSNCDYITGNPDLPCGYLEALESGCVPLPGCEL